MDKAAKIAEIKALLDKFTELAVISLLRTLRGTQTTDKALAIQHVVDLLPGYSVRRLAKIQNALSVTIDSMVGPERFLLIEAAV
jgi:hypothetical protein